MRWVPPLRSDTRGLKNEKGFEVVSYALVQGLILLLALALLQFALVPHTGNMVIAVTSEDARRGAPLGAQDAEAVGRTKALFDGLAGTRHYEVLTSRRALGDRSVLVVTVRTDLPLLVNLGPS